MRFLKAGANLNGQGTLDGYSFVDFAAERGYWNLILNALAKIFGQ